MRMHSALILPALLLASCQMEDQGVEAEVPLAEIPSLHISGQAGYRERIALLPGSMFEASLLDIARADAPSVPIAQVTRRLDGEQVPLPFDFEVKQHKLKTNLRYAVRATIKTPDGELAWTTDTVYLVDPTLESQDLGLLLLVRAKR